MSHDTGKPIFYMQDLTFTHLVVEKVSIPLSRQIGGLEYYAVYFVGSRKFLNKTCIFTCFDIKTTLLETKLVICMRHTF